VWSRNIDSVVCGDGDDWSAGCRIVTTFNYFYDINGVCETIVRTTSSYGRSREGLLDRYCPFLSDKEVVVIITVDESNS